MKTITTYIITGLLLVVMASQAQQANQKIEMTIDPIGNAKINISMTMTAAQWQQWNGIYGKNPSALKRDIERSMPAFIVDDFKLDKDEMNRSFNLSLNAYGVCKINKRGQWLMDTDQKNAQLTKLTDRKYMLVSSPPEFGGTIQQTYLIEFPESAKEIEVEKDSFGKSVFEFKMDNPSSSFNLMRWSGLFLMIIGGGWFGKNTLRKSA